MMKLSAVLGVVLLGFSACTPAASPSPVVEIQPDVHPDAGAAATLPPAPPPVVEKVCNNDDAGDYDCSTLPLGQCGAAEYYACPKKSKLPAGVGFRPKIALGIAECIGRPTFDCSDTSRGIRQVEACVREAVKKSCVDPSVVETCEKELGSCSKETRDLCTKFLSSLGDKTRVTAVKDLHSQRHMTGSDESCNFTWDLNGFPFCPYCPFTDR